MPWSIPLRMIAEDFAWSGISRLMRLPGSRMAPKPRAETGHSSEPILRCFTGAYLPVEVWTG